MAQNAENRSYPLKRKVLAGGGMVTGGVLMFQGVVSGPSDKALDYTDFANNINDVTDQAEQFKTKQGDQAVILLQGVKDELEKNPEYKNAKKESDNALMKAFAGFGIAAVSGVTGLIDYDRFDRKRRFRRNRY